MARTTPTTPRLIETVRPPGWVNPVPAARYNLVVIGAGTAGLVAAAGAAGLGARVALVERGLMGGDCLNAGCVPSKALLRSARVAAQVRDAGRYGVVVPDGVRVDFNDNDPSRRTDRSLRVLFVCVENSCRSQMAEAFARRLGAGRVEAFSAGAAPSGRVHPKVVEAMRELGYGLEGHRSKGLGELPDVEFDAVVAMGCGDACAGVRARRRESWELPAPKDLPTEGVRAVRDLIAQEVKGLLAGLGVNGEAERPQQLA